jgi:hypothetical protein
MNSITLTEPTDATYPKMWGSVVTTEADGDGLILADNNIRCVST